MKPPWGADIEKMLHTSAWQMSSRPGLHPDLARDDLKQSAREILLRCWPKAMSIDDAKHRYCYLRARAQGAMKDLNRQAWSQRPLDVESAGTEEAEAVGAEPSALLERKERAERVYASLTPLQRELADSTLAGEEQSKFAARQGFHASHTSRLLSQLIGRIKRIHS